MIDPINAIEEHRGVSYTIAGDFTNQERTMGNFVWRCQWGIGHAGDPETARRFVRAVIDGNLAEAP